MFTPNMSRTSRPDLNPILIDDDSDEDDLDEEMEFEYPSRPGRQQPPQRLGYNPPRHAIHAHPPSYTATIEQEKKIRSRLREERHAALCVLMDRELLTIQALAAQETLPQARRRFLAKLMAPEDAEAAASIRADRFTIQQSSGSPSTGPMGSSSTVQRRIVDVCEMGDEGWRRPTAGEALGGGGPSSSASSLSPAMATAPGRSQRGKGRSASSSLTPEKGRSGSSDGRLRASASRSQQHRDRERRRRWSGAGRNDEFGGFSP